MGNFSRRFRFQSIALPPTLYLYYTFFPSTPTDPINVAVAPVTASQAVQGITASAASKRVYVLGSIGYDFGSEARRDSFKQLMPGVEIDGITVPANPYDARQLVNYLAENPSEHKSLIWTINQELNPIYAIEVKGGFAADVYEMLQLMLAGQIAEVLKTDIKLYISRNKGLWEESIAQMTKGTPLTQLQLQVSEFV